MSQLNLDKIAATREVLLKRYPDYNKKATGERVLLAFSVLANDFKVREATGHNDGTWVTAILNGTELGPGYSWCAATVEFCCDVANANWGPSDRASAAVVNWYKLARKDGKLMSKPRRGCLCLRLNPDGVTGHIGICSGTLIGFVKSYEGNTSSGDTGSQDDGQGLYGRTRKSSFWQFYINLD